MNLQTQVFACPISRVYFFNWWIAPNSFYVPASNIMLSRPGLKDPKSDTMYKTKSLVSTIDALSVSRV